MTRAMKRQGRVWIAYFLMFLFHVSRPRYVWVLGRGLLNTGLHAFIRVVLCLKLKVSESLARTAFTLAAAKLPVRTKFVARLSGEV